MFAVSAGNYDFMTCLEKENDSYSQLRIDHVYFTTSMQGAQTGSDSYVLELDAGDKLFCSG
jgi:hypothetical protein